MSPRASPRLSSDMPHSPADACWPAEELEQVCVCPVCRNVQRSLLLDGLVDNVFFVAPGRWSLHRCGQCRSAYLSPRPTPASIGKAYGDYYTHVAGELRQDPDELRGFRRVRRMLANGYINRRYGTRYVPESAVGSAVARVLPGLRQSLDIKFRYLPKPIRGQTLLDIGCGNGDFLATARDAGWEVMGLEPDPAAAAVAADHGLDVRVGSLDQFNELSSCFDAITLNHVIEHMHWPVDVMASVHRLLRPGGTLYIETPNIDSAGASKFGIHWRGLECPRHLVLFTPDSLRQMLSHRGFVDIDMHRRASVAADVYSSSYKIAQDRSPYDAGPAGMPLWMRIRLRLRMTSNRRLEFITLTARKSGRVQ